MALFNILSNQGPWDRDKIGLLATVEAKDAKAALESVIQNNPEVREIAGSFFFSEDVVHLAQLMMKDQMEGFWSDKIKVTMFAVFQLKLFRGYYFIASEIKP